MASSPRPPPVVLPLLWAALLLAGCAAESDGAGDPRAPVPGTLDDPRPEPHGIVDEGRAPAADAGPAGPSAADPASGAVPEAAIEGLADFEHDTPGSAPAGWRSVPLGESPDTVWTIVDAAGRRCLRGLSEDGASGLALATDTSRTRLRWRWRVQALAEVEADETTRAGDDFAARVMVSFAERPGAGLLDAMQDAAARMAGHGDVPAAALAYVFARDLPAGRDHVSPFTERVHTFVVRGREDATGRWYLEERDLAADFAAAFGGPMTAITGVQLLTDSDDAGGRACALFDDLAFVGPPGG